MRPDRAPWVRRLVCVGAATSCLGAAAAALGSPDATVQLVVAGKPLELKPPAVLRNGKVVAPLQQCLPAVGARVTTEADGRLAIIAADGTEARLDIAHHKLTAGERDRELSPPIALRDDQHIVPIADVLRALGLAVTWDGAQQSLLVHPCVTDVRVRADDDGVAVEIIASAPTAFSAHTLPNPPRIYVDAHDAVQRVSKVAQPVGLLGVQRVRCDAFSQQPPVTRVVLDLNQAAQYGFEVSDDGRRAQLTIGQVGDEAPVVQRQRAQVCAVQTFGYEGGGADVVALLSAPTRHVYDVGRKPNRIVLGLLDAVPAIEASSFAGDDRLVERVSLRRSATDGHAELILDMRELMAFDVVAADDPPRIAVRFKPALLRERLIVLDPGHGGHDPGAKGRALREKDANLDVGRRLNALLQQRNVSTIMTRSTDVFIPLYGRPTMANLANADIFLSIHHNAWVRPDGAHGTETYYWRPKDKCLATIIHERMIAALGRKDNGVRRGNFAVLRESRMPAALCEVVYINHSNEEALAASDTFRQRAAQAIFDGLCQYVEGPGKPPEQAAKVGRG